MLFAICPLGLSSYELLVSLVVRDRVRYDEAEVSTASR
jgi:hypothetical protein